MKNLNRHIKTGNYEHVYLLTGNEPYLIRKYKNSLRSGIAGDDTFNVRIYEKESFNVNSCLEYAKEAPFFAERKLIILDRAELFKGDMSELVSLFEKMPETAYFIIIEESCDKRTKLYKSIVKYGYVCELNKQSDALLQKWVSGLFGKADILVKPEAVSRIIQKSGDSMDLLYQEVFKVISYVGDKKSVSLSDIETICQDTIENRVFEMIEALSNFDRKKVMRLYDDLVAVKEPPLKILFLIAKQYRELLTVKELTNSGMGKDEIPVKMKIRPYIASKLNAISRKYTIEQLKNYLKSILEYEEDIKTGKITDRTALELVITEFLNEDKRSMREKLKSANV